MSESGNNNVQAAASLSDELFDFFHPDDDFLSVESLRQIIERHRGTPKNNNPITSDYFHFFFWACEHEAVNVGIIQCLLEYFPINGIARNDDDDGKTPLHLACGNKNVSLEIIQLLIDVAPDSVRCVDNDGCMPLHFLCVNIGMDEMIAIEILKLLLEKCPESIRHADIEGNLPLHLAAQERSPEFCRVLIEAYPGSERISTEKGVLLLHCACAKNTLTTVEYLYKVYPDAINAAAVGLYPIHCAVQGMFEFHSNNPMTTVEIVRFLLDCDPNVKLQKFDGMSFLQVACRLAYDDKNVEAGLQVIKAIYDAHPEAIEEDSITSVIQRCHQQVQTFINDELVYARQANDHRLMTTPNEKGQLPLHRALQYNDRFGSIKLLVKGNPAAIGNADNNGSLPLHLACQYHDSPRVVKYLLSQDTTTLQHLDFESNTALHYACKGAKYDTIAMLLEDHDATSVSKRNAQEKLPIDLLWESEEVKHRESVEYLDSVFRLLKAYPETVMIYKQDFNDCTSQVAKKRKL